MRYRQGRRDGRRREPLPQRHSLRGGKPAGQGHRDPHRGVGTEPALVHGAIEIDHGLVDVGQAGPGTAAEQVRELGIDSRGGPEPAPAPVAGRVAVAPLARFPRSCRGTGGDPGAGDAAVSQPDLNRQRRLSARVQDLQRRQARDIENRHYPPQSPVHPGIVERPSATSAVLELDHSCRSLIRPSSTLAGQAAMIEARRR